METGCLLHCLEVEETNVFEAVKQSVTTRQAALVYGISVGRNGMACCPFHDDRHPSMKVDRRFHCFACQADGDVIDFTSRLFGLSSKEAALKLAEDFSISFDRKGHDPPQKRVIKRKISEEMRYRQAEQKCFRVLCDYLRLLERWKEEYAPKQPEDDWNPLFVEALHRQPYIMIMVRKIPRNGKPKMRKSLRMVLRVLTLMRNAIEQIEPFERSVFQIIAG